MTRVLLLLFPLIVFAHEGERHPVNDEEWETISEKVSENTLKEINFSYVKKVKPIFQNKCLDCHGSGNPLPWYASIPGPKHLILDDIKEAKKHMDMSSDFPFLGHGTPEDDLMALAKTVKQGSMPPLRYKIMHWSSSLNEDENKAISEWIEDSLNLINPKKEEIE